MPITGVPKTAPPGGWYYNVDPKAGTATQVVLCPAACAKVKSGGHVKVSLTFGCQTKVIQ
jgi:hypothetical protein